MASTTAEKKGSMESFGSAVIVFASPVCRVLAAKASALAVEKARKISPDPAVKLNGSAKCDSDCGTHDTHKKKNAQNILYRCYAPAVHGCRLTVPCTRTEPSET
eukprot:SAG31_NODE_8600_length_1422_cov_1.841270_2_plen_103_part_01